MRACSSMLATRRLAAFLVTVATFTLLAASGAAAPSDRVAELREHANSLAARERAAALDLYALESELSRARTRLAALRDRREQAEAELTRLRIQLDVAWQSVYVAEERLGARIRQLYERGDVNPIAVLLGAESLDEAVTRLESLRSLASGDGELLADLRRARAQLATAKRRVIARASALREAELAAAATAAGLEAARAERTAYLARLAQERGFTRRRIARLTHLAIAADRRSERIAVSASAPAAPQPVRAEVPAVAASGERTLTVVSTGYAIHGRTSTGIPTGWGVVAVDPSVIPLGTKMTIPGYGDGVAADTGSAVRGATIDLWFPTSAEALAWGRRTVTITLHG